MGTGHGADRASSAIITIPNIISALRILLIPAFTWLIATERTRAAGIVVFAVVAATDWVDGTIARRTGRVSEVGKVLDPVADRLVIAAGLIALVVAGLFPIWAAAAILARDIAVVAGGAVVLASRGLRIDVRFIGKVATFGLMLSVPSIAWGHLRAPLAPTATALGWIVFALAIVEYYIAAVLYAGDVRRALRRGGRLGAEGDG
jgi:cardiolipin synthase (CMP-forming)